MSEQSVLVLGARSDIAKAVAHKFASLGYSIQLAARDAPSLAAAKADLEVRYDTAVTLHEFDALETEAHAGFADKLPELPSVVICAVGILGEQSEAEQNTESAIHIMRSNYEGPASIFAELANRFEQRGSGTLVGISSVAGLRGRGSNYVYGSAKAGFTAFLSGLRNRLDPSGVQVLTVLPGFVATQMTEGMNLPSMLTAAPDELANAIESAVRNKKNVIYVRKIWILIMMIISLIPESIFKKLKI